MTDVAVIIAAWNAEAFIGGAVQSALAQTGVTLEVIVVDDASSDETLAAARAAAGGDDRLVCERLDQNGGPSVARNRALELVKARYVAVLDADDAMSQGRLGRLVALADETNADVVVDNMAKVVAPDGASDEQPFLAGPDARHPQLISLAEYVDPKTTARFGGGLGFLKPLFRMDSIRTAGLRYDASLRNSEDYYFVAELLAGGATMHFTPEAGYLYTVRDGSLSHRLSPALISAIVEAERRFQSRWGTQADPALKAAFQGRQSQLNRMDAFEVLVDAIKKRRLAQCVRVLVSRPAQVPFMIGRLFSIGVAKIFGLSDPTAR